MWFLYTWPYSTCISFLFVIHFENEGPLCKTDSLKGNMYLKYHGPWVLIYCLFLFWLDFLVLFCHLFLRCSFLLFSSCLYLLSCITYIVKPYILFVLFLVIVPECSQLACYSITILTSVLITHLYLSIWSYIYSHWFLCRHFCVFVFFSSLLFNMFIRVLLRSRM